VPGDAVPLDDMMTGEACEEQTITVNANMPVQDNNVSYCFRTFEVVSGNYSIFTLLDSHLCAASLCLYGTFKGVLTSMT
jgi:hypothetical protein